MKNQRLMPGRTRTAGAAILACLVALSGGCAMARHATARGANVAVQRLGGTVVKGELIGVRSDAIVLETKKGPATVPVADVHSVWTIKKMSGDGRTALAVGGLVGGLVLGVGTGRAAAKGANDWGDAIGVGSLYILGGVVVGEGVAVLIATRTHKGDVYVLKGRSQEEVERTLADLRELARVPAYR